MKPYDNPFWDFNDGGRREKRKEEEEEKKSMIIVVPSSDRLTACTATLGPIVQLGPCLTLKLLHYNIFLSQTKMPTMARVQGSLLEICPLESSSLGISRIIGGFVFHNI